MSLTTGRGPFSATPAGRFTPPIPHDLVYAEPFDRRVRAMKDGRLVVDSEQVWLVHRPGLSPTYAFPDRAVDPEVAVVAEEALPGYVRVPWDAADTWLEEEEQVTGHPRNPYHRVDILRTSRRLWVRVAGETLVDTTETVGVSETALAPRLYVRRDQVRTDLLTPSPTTTYCPYKGTASYWSATVGDVVVEDVVWSYEDPLPESEPIRGLLSFYETRATVVTELIGPSTGGPASP